MPNSKMLGVRIDADLMRQTKAAAALADKSLVEWVEEALRRALPASPTTAKKAGGK